MAATTVPSWPSFTLDSISIRREWASRWMTFGVGLSWMLATSDSRIFCPLGVSMGRFLMLVISERTSGGLQTWTSYALPPR